MRTQWLVLRGSRQRSGRPFSANSFQVCIPVFHYTPYSNQKPTTATLWSQPPPFFFFLICPQHLGEGFTTHHHVQDIFFFFPIFFGIQFFLPVFWPFAWGGLYWFRGQSWFFLVGFFFIWTIWTILLRWGVCKVVPQSTFMNLSHGIWAV